MSVLKNILLIVVLVITTSFIPINNFDTEITYFDEGNNQSYDVQTYIQWSPSGVGYWTESRGYYIYNDFDWMVSRSVTTINGYYYFDFWVYSQSYYWDGYTASYTSTNLRNVNVYVDGVHYVSDYSTLGITFNDTYNVTSLRIRTKNPQPIIYFKWDYMNAK